MTEIADNPSQTRDILSQHATETTQDIIKKLRGGSRKRAASRKQHHKAKVTKPKSASSSKKRKAPKTIKRDIFS